MATKKTKNSDSAKEKSPKKVAKKTVKKPAKKVAKKPAKKVAKKPAKKVAKKPAKKVAKKPAKKVSRKVTKKATTKKVVRKTTKKTAKKTAPNPVVQKQKTAPNPVVQKQVSSDEQKVTKFNFKITGYGSELAWAELDEDQFRFWRSKYDSAEDEYDAKRELIDHIRHGNGPQYGEDGHIGEHYNWNEDFEEYPFYQGSTIEIDLYGGDDGTDFIKCIELPLTDKRIKKSYYDGFVDKTPSKKKFKGGTVFAKTEDRGDYCIGEMDISEEDNDFSLENFELSIEKVQGYQYVSMISYNDMTLDYEKANDPYNKDFDAWIVWE